MITSYIKGLFSTGNERSIKAKKNILASFLFKGGSIIINLALVPITLNYLDSLNYGIWLTLMSIVGWFSFLDIGLGNGLRNKFAESIAKNDNLAANQFISTTYFLITFISILFFITFLCANIFINWSNLLNAPSKLNFELSQLAIIVFGFYCMKLVLQLITTILTADQKPFVSSLTNFITNLISLIVIYFIAKYTKNSIVYLGFALSIIPNIVLVITSFIFFKNRYHEYIPKFKYIDFKKIKKLNNLGFKFFLLQASGIILFTTDNMIITQLYNPNFVTPYNIAYKYFGLITMVFSIINTPFWSAYTDAYLKKEFWWIQSSIKKLEKIWLIFLIIGVFMLILAPYMYKIWIGEKVIISSTLSFIMFIFVVEQTWGSIYISFLNGVAKIQLQLYLAIIAAIVNIPLSILFAKYFNYGISGVMIATVVCLSFGVVAARIQYIKIINQKAFGIWNS